MVEIKHKIECTTSQYLPAGADPVAAEPIPEYTPRKLPALRKPCDDWMRVLIVSKGNNAISTTNPAVPPAFIKKKKR